MQSASRGMTLLETALALTLISGFMAGLFVLFRSQQETVSLVLGEVKASQQLMGPLSVIGQELANIQEIRTAGTSSIRYTSVVDGAATLREIRLAPPSAEAPRSRGLQLAFTPVAGSAGVSGGTSNDLVHSGAESAPMALGPASVIQNHNPDRTLLRLRSGTGKTTGPVPIFTYMTSDGEPTVFPSQIRRIEVYLVLRPTPESPTRYIRTSVTRRNP